MIVIKQQLSKKEKFKIHTLINEIPDTYSDFFITRNNLRLYIKENFNLLLENLRKGDYIIYDTEGNGLAIITGWADKSSRKYIKILSKDVNTANKLLKVINWNFSNELFYKIKVSNPIRATLLDNGFQFFRGRGIEILYQRPKRKILKVKINKEEI